MSDGDFGRVGEVGNDEALQLLLLQSSQLFLTVLWLCLEMLKSGKITSLFSASAAPFEFGRI